MWIRADLPWGLDNQSFHEDFRFLQIMIAEGLEISQPALDPDLSEMGGRDGTCIFTSSLALCVASHPDLLPPLFGIRNMNVVLAVLSHLLFMLNSFNTFIISLLMISQLFITASSSLSPMRPALVRAMTYDQLISSSSSRPLRCPPKTQNCLLDHKYWRMPCDCGTFNSLLPRPLDLFCFPPNPSVAFLSNTSLTLKDDSPTFTFRPEGYTFMMSLVENGCQKNPGGSSSSLYMIMVDRNDLIHGWGLDMKLGYCAQVKESSYSVTLYIALNDQQLGFQGDRTKKVGVIDSEYIIHQGIPSLGGQSENKAQSDRSIDLRAHIRRQSTAELEIFRQRWDQAVMEDDNWTDPF
ncbi:hypothetical protein HHK36_006526 [Tetracentron sinense]|uniref:Uncharacterized protein n=1 Tax=Tetracentron sinense TaxID=13715 RepID=A0A834ZL11_TETSI|nr:hypothetical protein HHK36_006526 [Tetracentron sinense]